MSLARKLDRLVLPDSLRDQLLGFRRQVWTIKLAEAALSAMNGQVIGSMRVRYGTAVATAVQHAIMQ